MSNEDWLVCWSGADMFCRFMDCEKWRAEYAGVGVEELVRTFDYKERPQVFEYYPQYYHKTDKVCVLSTRPATRTVPSSSAFQC
jgi:hypothetical protein